MYNYTIGSLLAVEREKRNISLRVMAKGICTHQLLGRIENGECDTDKLLIDIILQRLGKSPDKLECILSKEEYHKIRYRDLIEELILKGKKKKAEYLLEQYHQLFHKADLVQHMFYHRTRAYLLLRCDQNVEEAKKEIVRALDLTLPGWKQTMLSNYLISTYEMENLLCYAKILYLEGELVDAENLLEQCLLYIREKVTDTEEQCKIMPKCIWMLALIQRQEKDDYRMLALCEEALNLLREHSITYFMLPLMEQLLLRYEKIGARKKKSEWMQYKTVLEELYEEYVPDFCQDSLFFNCYQCSYHLDYEIIRAERLAKKMTQEELSEGVYQYPVSISNIEQGKSSPNRTKFELIMEKLSLEKNRYNGFVVTDSFEVIELETELNREFTKGNIERSKELLHKLKDHVDQKYLANYNLVTFFELLLRDSSEVSNQKHGREELYNVLEHSYRFNEKGGVRPPLKYEFLIVNKIAVELFKDHRVNEALELLEGIHSALRRSKVAWKYRHRIYSLLCGNISVYYSKIKKREIAIHISEQSLKKELGVGKCSMVSTYLWGLGCYCVGMKGEYDSKKLYQAYVISKLVLDEKNTTDLRAICIKYFNMRLD